MLHLIYHKPNVPSTRIRLQQMVPFLESRGVACRVAACPRSDAERSAFTDGLAPNDVVLVHRVRPSRLEARWWQTLPIVRIYDLDDAIMVGRKTGFAGWLQTRSRKRAFRRMLRACDGVTCGNAYLAGLCAGAGRATEIVPSPVPIDVPLHVVSAAGAPLRIGWVGRASNLRYLRGISKALAEVARARDVRVMVLSDRPVELPGCPVEHLPWSLAGECHEIARFDVGIMPLDLEGQWALGKCAYKLLQYMAAAVPAVGSRVGMNADLIRDRENGLLAETHSDWVTALLDLCDDLSLRAKIGAAGRATVCAGYSYEIVADRLVAFLRSVASGNKAER